MLVVIAIISILMTVGSIGISGLGGKGVTSGVATAEALFDEARSTAVDRFIYEFNAQGIIKTPGARFIIGSGGGNLSQPAITQPPRVT